MATDETSGRNPSGNPAIADIEGTYVGVRPEFDLNAVELEVTDQDGKGFRTLLGWEQGIDLALRVAVAVTRFARHRDDIRSPHAGGRPFGRPLFVADRLPHRADAWNPSRRVAPPLIPAAEWQKGDTGGGLG